MFRGNFWSSSLAKTQNKDEVVFAKNFVKITIFWNKIVCRLYFEISFSLDFYCFNLIFYFQNLGSDKY